MWPLVGSLTLKKRPNAASERICCGYVEELVNYFSKLRSDIQLQIIVNRVRELLSIPAVRSKPKAFHCALLGRYCKYLNEQHKADGGDRHACTHAVQKC